MPRVRPKFKDDETVVCWMPWAGPEAGPTGAMPAGTRLRGDHPAVKARPEWFHKDGAAPEEIPHFLSEVEHPRHAPLFEVPKRMRAEEAVTPIDSFRVGVDLYQSGTWYHREHPIVRQHPQLFRTVSVPLEAA